MDMIWDHIAHIIRDVFNQTTTTVLYGELETLQSVLNKPEHSIGAYLLHTEREGYGSGDLCQYWEIEINNCFFGLDFCDLFISFNYDPELLNGDTDMVASQIKNLLKPGGFALVINPGIWANDLGKYLTINMHVETEIKRYSLFSQQDVRVYENI